VFTHVGHITVSVFCIVTVYLTTGVNFLKTFGHGLVIQIVNKEVSQFK